MASNEGSYLPQYGDSMPVDDTSSKKLHWKEKSNNSDGLIIFLFWNLHTSTFHIIEHIIVNTYICMYMYISLMILYSSNHSFIKLALGRYEFWEEGFKHLYKMGRYGLDLGGKTYKLKLNHLLISVFNHFSDEFYVLSVTFSNVNIFGISYSDSHEEKWSNLSKLCTVVPPSITLTPGVALFRL